MSSTLQYPYTGPTKIFEFSKPYRVYIASLWEIYEAKRHAEMNKYVALVQSYPPEKRAQFQHIINAKVKEYENQLYDDKLAKAQNKTPPGSEPDEVGLSLMQLKGLSPPTIQHVPTFEELEAKMAELKRGGRRTRRNRRVRTRKTNRRKTRGRN